MKKFLGLLCAVCICLGFATLANSNAKANALAQADWESLVDFIVEVEEGRDIRVLQLSDTQVIAGDDNRRPSRGNGNWIDKEVEKHEKYVEQIILSYKPDFIFVAGDIIYGEFDDNGDNLLRYIEFMESFGIPWAPVLGNHDPESNMGVDWQCEQFERAEHCLFKQRTLTGNGNYTVGLAQGGELKRVFFMLDSNGSHSASKKTLSNGHTQMQAGFGNDQIEWYTGVAQAIRGASPETKLSFVFHIQLYAFVDAFAQYGFTNKADCLPIDIDNHPDRKEGDFGYIGAVFPTLWDSDYKVWNGLKALGVDSIFVGHEHCNSGSVTYEGIRMQYGQKSTTYDMANYLLSDGGIVGSYDDEIGVPIIGGTALPVSEEDGSFVNPHIVYYEDGASIERAFDFNGVDFDASVKTPLLKDADVAVKVASAPAGYEGGVYFAESKQSVSVGFEFYRNLIIENITSLKLRAYVSNYNASTPTLSVYASDSSGALAQMQFPENSFGKWVDIDVLPLLKTASGLEENGAFKPFTISYDCNYVSGETPKVYFDGLTVTYTEVLYQLEKVVEKHPLMAFEEGGISQYRTHSYYRYTLSDLGEKDALAIKGKQSKTYKVGDKGYSLTFSLTAKKLKDVSVMLLADNTGGNGYSFSFMTNGVSLDRPNGHPLDLFDYEFNPTKTVEVEVGFVRFDYNEKTGAGNGNTAYIFAKIDGEVVAWRLLELFGLQGRQYLTISTYYEENDVTLGSYNVVEYRTAGGKLLMKELSKNNIAVTQEKVTLYAQGLAYTGVSVNGGEFTDGKILDKGVNVVTINTVVEPEGDLYGGSVAYDLTTANVILGGSEYDGVVKEISPVVQDGAVLTEGVDYTLEFFRGNASTTDFTSAGEVTVLIKGAGKYVGQTEAVYVITQREIEITTSSQVGALSQDADKLIATGLVAGDEIAGFTLKKEDCKVKVAGLQIKNASGKDVTDCYTVTYNYGEGHSYGEWVDDGNGIRECVCEGCGDTITEAYENNTSTPQPTGCKGGLGGGMLFGLGLIAVCLIKRKREE